MPDVEDFLSPEVGVAVAVTSAILHPAVRKTVRRGLVLGVAGGLALWEGAKDFAAGFNPAPFTDRTPRAAEAPLQDVAQEAQGKGKSVRRKDQPS